MDRQPATGTAKAVPAMRRTGHPLAFCLRFLALYAVSLVVLVWLEPTAFGSLLIRATARASAWALWPIDPQAYAHGALVVSRFGPTEIIYECTAVFPIMIFASAVLAFPVAWRARVRGLVIGTIGLLAINEVRILTLIWITGSLRDAFETVHLVVWPAVLILV